jgi:O-antigen/teichoic acid export membrane protein
LGPKDYGFLVLLGTFAFFVVGGLVSFQPWFALIHFGAKELVDENKDKFKRLIKFGIVIDAAAALAGAAVGAACLFLFSRWKGWPADLSLIGILYGASLLLRLPGTATAVFRLFDRFDLQAAQQAVAALIRLACILTAFIGGWGFRGFLIMWLVSETAGQLLLPLLGFYELRRRGFHGILQTPLRGVTRQFPGIWKFLISTNLQATLRMSAREFDILFVGAILGNSAAGLFKIARQFARVITRLEDNMRQAVYPDMARQWALRDPVRFRALLGNPALILGAAGLALWLGFAVFGKTVLLATVGESYLEAYGVTLVFMAGTVVSMTTFNFPSTLMAMGRPQDVFRSMALSAGLYLIFLTGLTYVGALIGAAAASVLFELILAGRLGWAIRKQIRGGHFGEYST